MNAVKLTLYTVLFMCIAEHSTICAILQAYMLSIINSEIIVMSSDKTKAVFLSFLPLLHIFNS